MKKLLMCGVVGLVTGSNSAVGQGFIRLDNYDTTPSPLVTFGAGVPVNGVNGQYGIAGGGLNSNWTVGFYFASRDVAADTTIGNGLVSPLLSLATGFGSTAA